MVCNITANIYNLTYRIKQMESDFQYTTSFVSKYIHLLNNHTYFELYRIQSLEANNTKIDGNVLWNNPSACCVTMIGLINKVIGSQDKVKLRIRG